MCTCLDLKCKDYYFGRNLDLDYSFGEKVTITPRNYLFNLKNGESFNSKYAMIGMATIMDDYPMYAEASNEKGLSIAGLNFPGNAFYNGGIEGRLNIAAFELIPYILGNFNSVSEVRCILHELNITNVKFNQDVPAGELHWIISDKDESIVLESTRSGLHAYNNPFGVLTNNPEFSFHRENMNNYLGLSAHYPSNKFSNELNLEPCGQGFGAFGLPGDVSPQSRFVRCTFNKFNSFKSDNELENVAQFFHILDSVSFVKGAVITDQNRYDITTYSCCINASKGIYYYKTYYNNQINRVILNDSNMNSNNLTIYDLCLKQNINFVN